eukprot:m.59179 g.59179  ORF g.59179 m.59179 type:complete len:363 (+) comp11310_c0_seq1:69-1157(+)
MNSEELPHVDFAQLVRGDAISEDVCAYLDKVLQTHGLVEVQNVFTKEEEESYLHVANEFFELAKEQKMGVGTINKNGFIRGYLQYGAESGQPDKLFEPKEGFSWGFEHPTATTTEEHEQHDREAPNSEDYRNKLEGPNLWPLEGKSSFNNAAQFKEKMCTMFDIMSDISMALVKHIATALHQPVDDVVASCVDGKRSSLMRLFHYHPATPEYEQCVGSSPHTDWGFLTTIMQDSVGGLQFLDTDTQQWHDVPYRQGSIVVNVGDFLQIISGGRYKSPIHKVLCPKETRTSFVMFHYPNYNTPIDTTLFKPIDTDNDFNTFLEIKKDSSGSDGNDGDGDGESPTLSFGDYICEKWEQVQVDVK